MLAYILRRTLYAIPILIGVNLITFALFFVVNTPDDMARMQLGAKRVTQAEIERWKAAHGYDKPMLWNARAAGSEKLTADGVLPQVGAPVRLRLRRLGGRAQHRRRDPHAHVAEPRARHPGVPRRAGAQHQLRAGDGILPRHLPRLLGRRAVRGDDVDIDAVLHHRRPVPGGQALGPGSDLGLQHRPARDQVPDPAGGDRRAERRGRRKPLVQDAVPGGDGQGLRAHGARQGPLGRRW